MRYERVQEILQNDPFMKTRLGPRTQQVDTRFGEKTLFSKEVFEVTNAIHQEGKDAHKVPKIDVLRVAMRVMKILPANGEIRTMGTAPSAMPPADADTAAPAVPPEKRKPRAKITPKTKPPVAVEPPPARRKPVKPATDTPKASKAQCQPVKMASKTETAPAENKSGKTTTKTAKSDEQSKAEKPKPASITPTDTGAKNAEKAEDPVPESELPPEQQPLHLPVQYDPRKYPHYDVQSTLYCLLLSALNLSDHFEKFAGYEERQKDLEALVKKYLGTCDPIKLGT